MPNDNLFLRHQWKFKNQGFALAYRLQKIEKILTTFAFRKRYYENYVFQITAANKGVHHSFSGDFMNQMKLLDLSAVSEILDQNRIHDLRKFSKITPEAAEVLSDIPSPLDLSGLTQLEALSAQFLHRRQHGATDLNLDGLGKIDPETAQQLFQSKGLISLRGLDALSAEVAEPMKFHTGILQLSENLSLSEEAARHFRNHCGELWLSPGQVSTEAVIELARHGGALWFYGGSQLPHLPADQRAAFLQTRLTAAHLQSDWMDAQKQEIESYSKPWNPYYWPEGDQSTDEPLIDRFESIDVTAAKLIAENPHWTTDTEALHLTALKTLSLAQAQALAQTKGRILLGFPQMSPETRLLVEESSQLLTSD